MTPIDLTIDAGAALRMAFLMSHYRQRCGCRGYNDMCGCQNTPDHETLWERAAAAHEVQP